MKKTLLTAVLCLLCTGAVYAAGGEQTSYTFSSTLEFVASSSGTNPNGYDETITIDVFSLMSSNKNQAEIEAASGTIPNTSTPYVDANNTNNASDLLSRTITLSEFGASELIASTVVLDSYAFITRASKDVTNGLYVQVWDGETLLGTSSAVSYNSNATNHATRYGVGTFTFEEDDIVLYTSKAYTFRMVTWDAENEVYTAASAVKAGLAQGYYTEDAGGYKIDGETGLRGVISITSHAASASIPEPATATLSLLALAGLAVRRRRK